MSSQNTATQKMTKTLHNFLFGKTSLNILEVKAFLYFHTPKSCSETYLSWQLWFTSKVFFLIQTNLSKNTGEILDLPLQLLNTVSPFHIIYNWCEVQHWMQQVAFICCLLELLSTLCRDSVVTIANFATVDIIKATNGGLWHNILTHMVALKLTNWCRFSSQFVALYARKSSTHKQLVCQWALHMILTVYHGISEWDSYCRILSNPILVALNFNPHSHDAFMYWATGYIKEMWQQEISERKQQLSIFSSLIMKTTYSAQLHCLPWNVTFRSCHILPLETFISYVHQDLAELQ